MPLILPYNGKTPKIHDSAFIAENAVIAGDVEIGPDSNIWYGCVIRGDVNRVVIGARTNIQDGTVVHEARPHGAIIGDDVTIGHMALIHACTLEDGSFVGMRAVVMDGAVVESGAMLGAGALLAPNKRVPTGEVWLGQPARFARKIQDAEDEYMGYVAPNYVKLGQEYKKEEEKSNGG